jgi:ribosomal protein S18 acetylase RimI-like enzyme
VYSNLSIVPATSADLESLVAIEQACFSSDRLSRRSFKHWLSAPNGLLLILCDQDQRLGYGLILLHKGTRLARLYSLALLPEARGKGAAQFFLGALEKAAAERGRLFMRLEVAKNNPAAIALYQRQGYRVFGEYSHYYEDDGDALRMQKRIRHVSQDTQVLMAPWYQQTTEFTCGPASLMMAMNALNPHLMPSRSLELDIWREATTIFMTSGHGGCHPLGLALAAQSRQFETRCYINTEEPLFVHGVRSPHKKELVAEVDREFKRKSQERGMDIRYQAMTLIELKQAIKAGFAPLVLISTYRMDGKKSPHWVLITALDDHCLYVHDPDFDVHEQTSLDSQHVPIALEDFERMSSYGTEKLRVIVLIRYPSQKATRAK